MTAPTELDLAAHEYECAKAEEARARDVRLAAEQRLIDLVGLKEEGTEAKKTAYYKVSTTAKLTRTLNMEQASMLDPVVFDAIARVKHELDVRGLKSLATSNPDAYRAALRAVTTKPTKPAVKVEQIQETTKETQ